MMTKWHGPYRIIKVHTRPQGRVYTIYNAKKQKEKTYHEAYLKPYPTEEGFGDIDAIRVSVLDDEMFVIEKIIAHRNDENNQLELLIQWYGVEEPEWKKYDKKMNNNIFILQYLEKKGFKQMLTTAQKRRLEEEKIPNQNHTKIRFEEEEQQPETMQN